MNNHPNKRIRQLITELTDELCEWERSTGSENVLIIKDDRGFVWIALNGKPELPSRSKVLDIHDRFLLEKFGGK